MSKPEMPKYRHLVRQYCYKPGVLDDPDRQIYGVPGCGIDIGSGGHPIVPWAIGIDLPLSAADHYGHKTAPTCQLRWFAEKLPFESGSLDWACLSHVLEDYTNWEPLLIEWLRILRPGGYLIILVPDKELFRAAVASGVTEDNLNHRHESYVGEISSLVPVLHAEVIEDRRTNLFEGDYTILAVLRRPTNA